MDLDDVAAADIDQKTKSDQYRGILEQAVSQGDAAACRRFVDHGAMLERLLSGALRFTSPPPPAVPPACSVVRCRPPRAQSAAAAGLFTTPTTTGA